MTKCFSPTEIATLGRSFMEAKVLLAAVRLRLFDVLEDGPLTGSEIGECVGPHPRAIPDFPDTLVALRVLERDFTAADARGWRADAGFRYVALPPLGGPASAAIAYK